MFIVKMKQMILNPLCLFTFACLLFLEEKVNCKEGTIKSFSAKIPAPNEITATGLACPLKNTKLYEELQCGISKNYTEPLILIYSGSYDLKIMPFFSVFCIDIVVKNFIAEIEGLKSIWHGKCFVSKLTDVNEYMPIQNIFRSTENKTEFYLNYNDSTLYSLTLPSLTDSSSFTKYDLTNTTSFTSHTHFFDKFYSNKTKDFCMAQNGKSIMNLQSDRLTLYIGKLKDPSNAYLSENFFREFGLGNSQAVKYTRDDIDMKNCATFVFTSTGNYTQNMLYNVKDTVTMPVLPSSESISTNSTFNDIFVNIPNESISQTGLSKEKISNSFDINNALREYINKEILNNNNNPNSFLLVTSGFNINKGYLFYLFVTLCLLLF